MAELDPIKLKQAAEERMDGKSQASKEERNKVYHLNPVRDGMVVVVRLPIHGY